MPQPPRTPTDVQVRWALAEALNEVYTRDSHLFTALAGERAVIHKLCVRLTPIVEGWDGGWTVDAEYNRMSPTTSYPDVAYKYLLDVLGDEIKPAYPDLIVHRPGVAGADGGNLLVVEAKRSPSGTDRRVDHAKLVAWCRKLGYVRGVRLELGPREPRWAWVGPASAQRRIVAARPVSGGH